LKCFDCFLVPTDGISLVDVAREGFMAKNTSILLGDHFEAFIAKQIEIGRYGSASEVVRQGLRLLEEHEQKVSALRQSLIDGENSGNAGSLDMNAVRRKARRKAALDV
jgi:antitoxin ParD1/3/4